MQIAVANKFLNSTYGVRPLRPARKPMNSMSPMPGAPFPNAVAMKDLNSRRQMRLLRPAKIGMNSIDQLPGAPFRTCGSDSER
jgi:hypothetical protein